MTIPVDQLVQQIHDSQTRIVLAATGGGSRAIADLLEVPGASRTLLAAFVPYSDQAMIDYLGSRPDEFCSNRTARAMAMAAFLHARKLAQSDAAFAGLVGDLAGVACTAGLVTDRPRHGSHRIHVALQTIALTATWSLELLKGRRSRPEEEHVAGRMLLNAVAESCGVEARLTLDLLEGEKVEELRTVAHQPWQDLLLGKVEILSQGKTIPANPAILSGAFNPLHVGHRRIAELAADLLKKPVIMEITILNPDKPPLDYYEIDRRTAQFAPDQPLYLTRAATFDEKARLFPARHSWWARIRCGASPWTDIITTIPPPAALAWNISPSAAAIFWSSAATWARASCNWPISTCLKSYAQSAAMCPRKFSARMSLRPAFANPARGECRRF